MKSAEFIQAKLENRLTADCSSKEVKNNRYHYSLRFDEPIGWDWVGTQVEKCAITTDTALELCKVRPSGVGDFEIEVREVARREGIDDSQAGLDSFE